MFALYGHLSAQSLIGLQHNKTFKKGEVIGYFGKESENGGWSPHVHFQLAIEEPITHDLPGVVSNEDHERAML